jgi:hypothetical protein
MLKNSSKITERPKAIFEELIKKLAINTTTTTSVIINIVDNPVSNSLETTKQEILKLVNQERARI